jgi:phage gpG-like protein
MEYDFKPSIAITTAHIAALAEGLDDFKEPLKECIEKVVIPSIRANFDAGGRPTWAPYAQSTLDFHKMLGEAVSDAMLVKTGSLRDTMDSSSIWTITKEEAYIADLPAEIWYGKVHQGGYGGGSNNGPIPARPFVLLQDSDLEAIDDVFAKWLDKQIVEKWTI